LGALGRAGQDECGGRRRHAIGKGIGHAWREVCFFPGYARPLSVRPVLEGLSCPVWPRVKERKTLPVYFDDVNCTSFGIPADFLEPNWDEHKCFAREQIAGVELTLKDGIATLRRK
jgi:hypothetical protein